jgi:formate dehydrogenase subunit delta
MDIERLRYMADQIGKNFEANGHDEAVAATAEHIRKFWDPRMKSQIYGSDLAPLSNIAREAIEQLMADAKAA